MKQIDTCMWVLAISNSKIFGASIFNSKITLSEYGKNQNNLLENILKFNSKVTPTSIADKKKSIAFKSINALCEDREFYLNAFKSGIFALKHHKEKDSKY